ncbi:MAG TPA: right-handed parallel beta-helix repeat-containing protein, partial [Enhygromyxa sp.]|nr:right-handed parallel beta-helix repeat-containing protein [Enhygromyxa sp.]
TVATDSALRDGDLVEVLSDIVELGDVPSYPMPGGDAVIALDGTFTPPARQAGVLAVLVAQEPDSYGRPVFALRQVADPSSPVSLPPTQYEPDQRVILRRWHGLIDGADGATHEIESGIEVTLAGARFDVGDWWNYEARVLTHHDNGAWPSVAHGPERRFAPLALLELPNTTGAPVTVTEWPDDRFASLCASMADDIGYDGSSVCSTADTVQEAIDELYARSGCCKVVFSTCHPEGVDDQILIKELIERELPEGGVLCLAKGTYEFGAALDIPSLNITGELVIRGCDGTIITNASSYAGPLLIVNNAASLTLDNLILHSPAGVAIQVEFWANSSLRARHCAFVVDGPGAVAIGDPAASLVPINIAGGLEPMNYPNPPMLPPGAVLLELHDCTMLAELGIRGFVMRRLLIERTAIRASIAALSCHWIGELHLRDSLLGDGLQSGDIPGIAALVATPASALAVAWQPSPAAGGSALLGHVISNAKLENTRLSGNFTLFADEIWDSRLTTCDIYGGSRAVMLNRLCNSAIEDSRVVAGGDAVVINIDARMVSISDSLLVGSGGGGLEITAVYYGPPMRAEGVQVLGNIVLGAQRGIDVGPDGGGDILFRDVLIADNLVYEIGQPIFPGVRLRRLDTSEGSMVLTGNKVSWRQTSAVFVEGVNIHVNDNHIVHGYNGVAVQIIDGVGVIVRGNTIECIEEMTAIEAVNTSDVTIQDNVVKSVSGHDLSGLSLIGTGDPELGPRIIGNEFGPGQSQIVDVGRAIVRNNLFRGAILVKDPMDLVFCDNVIESRVNGGLIQDACIIDGIRQGNYEARAQVNGNRVYGDGNSGALRVLPEIVNGDWEADFHVQVCHNWSNILVIGYCADNLEDPPWDEGSQYDEFRNVSTASRIQVIGNRAQFIGANSYEVNAYSIATLNMADYYNSYIIANNSNPILAPNVKL